MTIEIPADLQPFVRQQLQLGCFPNEQQLVTENSNGKGRVIHDLFGYRMKA